jgi:hypothetical protein
VAATNREISTTTNTRESETAGRYCQAIGAPVIRIEIGQVLMERDASKVPMRRHLEVSDSDDPNDPDYGPRPGPRQDRDNAPEAERIINVLDYMKSKGFASLGSFHKAVFNSNDDKVKRRVGKFFQHGGFKESMALMLKHQKFGGDRRMTVKATDKLRDDIGEELRELHERLLDREMRQLEKVPFLRLRKDEIKSDDVKSFSVSAFMKIYREHAPTLTASIESMCRSFRGRESSGRIRKRRDAEEVEEAEEGDQAEGDQAEGDQAEGDQAEGDQAEEGDEADGDEAEGDQAEEGDEAEELREILAEQEEELWGIPFEALSFASAVPTTEAGRNRKRVGKDRDIVVVCIISQMLFAKSRMMNRFQVHKLPCL